MSMKQGIIYISILFLLSTSCDVFDVEDENRISAEDAFRDKEGIEQGILGAYTYFQELSYFGRNYQNFADLASDNLDHPTDGTSQDYAQVNANNVLPDNGGVLGIWSSAFGGINAANYVITQVPLLDEMTEEEKNAALGELYFIRALNLFNLMNYFGAIPIRTEPTIGTGNVNIARQSVDAVYAQIIGDLTFAETHLPDGGTKTRASSLAASALLARVYLYQQDYTKAIAKATAVIESDQYALLDYAAIFAEEQTDESIFEVAFTELNRNRIAEYHFPKSLAGRREIAPSQSLLDAYESGDERFDATIQFASGLAYSIKYDDLATGADNFILLRLGEMYLIRAEALALSGGSIAAIQADLNAIRSRAGLDDTNADTLPELIQAIEDERRVEFAFEGHRWFDLVRTGRAVDVLVNVTNENQTLFPIPLDEILTNEDPGMTQNPGY